VSCTWFQVVSPLPFGPIVISRPKYSFPAHFTVRSICSAQGTKRCVDRNADAFSETESIGGRSSGKGNE